MVIHPLRGSYRVSAKKIIKIIKSLLEMLKVRGL